MAGPARKDSTDIAVRVAAIYAIFSALWILFSDRIVETLGMSTTGSIGTIKGLLFVVVTGAGLYVGVKSWAARLEIEHERTLDAERVLSQLARDIPVGLLMVDHSGRLTFMNAAAADLFGVNAESSLGQPLAALSSGLAEDDAARVLARVGDMPLESRTEFVVPGGPDRRTVVVSAESLDPGDASRGIFYAISDVTDSVSSARRSQRLLLVQRFLTDVALTVSRAYEPQRMLAEIGRLAVDKGGFAAAWVIWRDGDDEAFETVGSVGLDGYGDMLRVMLDDLPSRRSAMTDAFRAGEIYVSNSLSSMPGSPMVPLSSDGRLGASAAVPIVEGGVTVACLTLFSAEVGYFGTEELQVLRTLQAALSFGVERVSLDRRRIEAEEALERSESAYRRLFDQNPQPMWIYDLETLRFLAVNDAAVRKYGYSRDEFDSMTIADIRPAEDIEALTHNVEAVSEGLDEAGVWRHVTKDGHTLAVDITSHTVEWEGRSAELVMVRDVTGLYEAEADLVARADRVGAALAERASQLAQLSTAVDTCLAAQSGVAALIDEARPPLNGLVGFTAVLLRDLDGDLTPEQAQVLREMGAEGRRLIGVLGDLQDIIGLESGLVTPERVGFDLSDSLNRVVLSATHAADTTGTFLALDAEPGIRTASDSARVARVIRWLIDDALARACGGSVHVTARREGPDVIVTVRATGGTPKHGAGESHDMVLARRMGRVLTGGRPAVAVDGEVAVFRFHAV